MVLNFSLESFRRKIEKDEKIHSIRTGVRWKMGMKIHLATGARTKHYNCFGEKTCTGVQCVEMLPSSKKVWVDKKALKPDEVMSLAKNDGFENTEAFFDFFESGVPGDLFTGQLIHWTDKRY